MNNKTTERYRLKKQTNLVPLGIGRVHHQICHPYMRIGLASGLQSVGVLVVHINIRFEIGGRDELNPGDAIPNIVVPNFFEAIRDFRARGVAHNDVTGYLVRTDQSHHQQFELRHR